MTCRPFRMYMPANPSRARFKTQRAMEDAVDRLNAARAPEEVIVAQAELAKRRRAFGARVNLALVLFAASLPRDATHARPERDGLPVVDPDEAS